MNRPSPLAFAFCPRNIALVVILAFAFLLMPARVSSPNARSKPPAPGQVTRSLGPSSAKEATLAQIAKAAQSYGRLPLSFEPNLGQTERGTRFLSHGPRQALFLKSSEADLVLMKGGPSESKKPTAGHDLTSLAMLLPEMLRPEGLQAADQADSAIADILFRMKLAGAREDARGIGLGELPGTANYFYGNDSGKWITNIKTYARVKFQHVYPGIDLIYYGNSQQLEYDFIVSPGADPRQIQMDFEGADRLSVDKSSGDLVLAASDQEIRLVKPVVYQMEQAAGETGSGTKHIVDGHYRIEGNRRVSFEVAKYDTSKPLIIDPVLSYYTYLGGLLPDVALHIAVDSSGNAYVTGATVSPNFPTNAPFQSTYHMSLCSPRSITKQIPCPDAFVTKLNSTGTAALYSTFLGGSRSDLGIGIAVDSNGDAYVAGETESPDFPVTASGFQTTFAPFSQVHTSAAFLAKLNPAGSQLLYSTYLFATSSSATFGYFFDDSFATAVAADNSGNAFVAGYTRSLNFPTTPGVAQPSLDGVGCRFLVNGSSFPPSAGGSLSANVVGPAGCNWTAVSNVPWISITSGSSGSGNGVVNFSVAANTGLARSGSLTIAGQDFIVNQSGTVTPCVTSVTTSSFNVSAAGAAVSFAVAAPVGCNWSSNSPASWITITSGSSGSGNGNVAVSLAANSGPQRLGNINVSGQFGSISQNGVCGLSQCSDGFVSKINTNASGTASLVYSTYLGGNNFDVATGVAIDSAGDAYVSGTTLSSNFPVANAFQASPKGGRCGQPGGYPCASAFVAKLNPAATALLFSTYLGGSANNAATSIAVDSSGSAYVTGFTNSADFPVSSGVKQPSLASASCSVGAHSIPCPDAFAVKFSSSGSLAYSTYLGGTGADLGFGIAADSQGNAYVTGMTNSTDFPTASPTQPNLAGGACPLKSNGVVFNFTCPNVFVSELNPSGAALLFSTYLGGTAGDIGTGIGLDTSSNPNSILVTGVTLSSGLATTGVFQSTPGGKGDAFVAKIAFPPPDFSMSAASGGSTSATVTAGGTATYNLQVTPSGGFTGTVNLSCTGAPTKASCSPSAPSVSVTGASSVAFSVSVSTTKNGLLPQSPIPDPGAPRWYVPLVLLALLLIAAYALDRAARLGKRRFAGAFAGVLLACIVLLACGCGGGGYNNQPPPNGTPPGTYTLTLAGTSQGTNHSLNLMLTVN